MSSEGGKTPLPLFWGARTNAEPLVEPPAPANDSNSITDSGSAHDHGVDAVTTAPASKPSGRTNVEKAPAALPFGWDDRTNATKPVSSKQDREQVDEMAAALHLQEATAAPLPVGWGDRTNATKSVSSKQDREQVDEMAAALQLQEATAASLPVGWGDRTNATEASSSNASTAAKASPAANASPTTSPAGRAPPAVRATPAAARLGAANSSIAGLVVGTRLHFKDSSTEELDAAKVTRFLDNVLAFADTVVIAVGASPSTVRMLEALVAAHTASANAKSVTVLPVSPWGNFIPALNAIVSFAATRRHALLCLQSLEVNVDASVAAALAAAAAAPGTLVAGAAFPGQHAFSPGERVVASGQTVPWNTLAVWDVATLALTGFALVAEGNGAEVPAGVEEVATISVLQRLLPRRANAVLVMHPRLLSSSGWVVDFKDEARRKWHARKMASKLSRAAAQLDALGIDPGIINHVVHPVD